MNTSCELTTSQILWVLNHTNYGFLVNDNLLNSVCNFCYTCEGQSMQLKLNFVQPVNPNDFISNHDVLFYITVINQNTVYTLVINGQYGVIVPNLTYNHNYQAIINVKTLVGYRY